MKQSKGPSFQSKSGRQNAETNQNEYPDGETNNANASPNFGDCLRPSALSNMAAANILGGPS